jgi:DNA-binding MarR family transcriptional regulator
VDFRLPADLEVVHQPVRLRIVTLLYRERDIGFAAMRGALDLTAGNLASHLERLDAAGLVDQRRTFSKDGLEARIRLTPLGAAGFQRYLALLRDYLAAQG